MVVSPLRAEGVGLAMRKPNPADVERFAAVYVTIKNARALLHSAQAELNFATQPTAAMRDAIQAASTALQRVQLDCTRHTDPEHAPLLDAI
jgi:hypothetical protein